MGATYNPPPTTEDVVVSGSGWDPEMGEVRKAFISTEEQGSSSAIQGLTAALSPQVPAQTQPPPIDLLDSNHSTVALEPDTIGGSIHELD
jgi:hypothetical protein